jgi:hypothetical protein
MSRSAADSPPGPRARRRPRSVANARDRFLEHYELLADAAVMVRATPPNEPSLMAQRDWTIVRGTSWRSPCQHYREDAAGTEGALCLGHAPQIRSVAHARCHRRVRTSSANGVPSPKTMIAVYSPDHQAAEKIISGDIVNDHAPVYVIEVTGGPFADTNASVPPGAPPPRRQCSHSHRRRAHLPGHGLRHYSQRA